MTIRVVPDAEVIEEARKILLQHMTPSKAARFLAIWHQGNEHFLGWRDETLTSKELQNSPGFFPANLRFDFGQHRFLLSQHIYVAATKICWLRCQ